MSITVDWSNQNHQLGYPRIDRRFKVACMKIRNSGYENWTVVEFADDQLNDVFGTTPANERRVNPEVIAARINRHEGTKRWDRLLGRSSSCRRCWRSRSWQPWTTVAITGPRAVVGLRAGVCPDGSSGWWA